MIYNYFILGLFFAMTFVFGMGVGVTIALLNVQTAHAQTNTTVSVPVPITVPVLQYSPTPSQQPAQTQPQENQGINEIIVLVLSAAGIYIGKMASDRKASKSDKDIMATILHDKQIQAELARVMYSLNPEKANAINDAPTVRLENLEKETKEYSEKAAKA